MNGVERVTAALSGQITDRPPVAPLLGLYGARLAGCPLEQYYTDPAAYAGGQAAVGVTFDPDILFAPFAFALIGEAFGSQLRWVPNQPPVVRIPAVADATQFDHLALPDPRTHPRLQFFIQAVSRMMADSQGQVVIAAPLPGPADLPPLIMGLDAWMETLIFDPEGTQRVLAQTETFVVDFANCLFAAGAAFVIFPLAYLSPLVVTRPMAETIGRPVLQRTLPRLKGPVVLHHAGGPILAHLDLLTGLPQVPGVAVDQGDDLDQARAILGPELVLLAGLNGPNLPAMSAAQVSTACRAILANRRNDPRFILITGGPDIPFTTPPENIMAIRRAVDEV